MVWDFIASSNVANHLIKVLIEKHKTNTLNNTNIEGAILENKENNRYKVYK